MALAAPLPFITMTVLLPFNALAVLFPFMTGTVLLKFMAVTVLLPFFALVVQMPFIALPVLITFITLTLLLTFMALAVHYVTSPGANVTKLLRPYFTNGPNMLENLSTASFFQPSEMFVGKAICPFDLLSIDCRKKSYKVGPLVTQAESRVKKRH
jgi:hypothetical protein